MSGRSRRETRQPTPGSTPTSGRHLTPRQQRELAGLVIGGLGVLSLIAMVHVSGSALDSLAGVIWELFGLGWPLAVAAAIGGGAFMVWPNAPALPRLQVGAGMVGALALLGLASLVSGPAGGGLGRFVLALVQP